MYDKDPVRTRPPAHHEGWFVEETTVPLPHYLEAERERDGSTDIFPGASGRRT
ncbi:hypothetical protein [Methanoculleus formosensis]|uniref:hypothetical protein n=1 Tax=Methanoculleus formosensis TaxID=2590886 RepID=UPI0021C009CB|nr:hypothetical protein [Methanoculleus sp. Afa-1]